MSVGTHKSTFGPSLGRNNMDFFYQLKSLKVQKCFVQNEKYTQDLNSKTRVIDVKITK